MEEINALLKKYNKFSCESLRSITPPSDESVIVTLVIMDEDGEDEKTIRIEFINVTKSRILVNDVLAYLDMMSGISIVYANKQYGFAVGNCDDMLHIRAAPCYIVSEDIRILQQ